MAHLQADQLIDEAEIVWLVPAQDLLYVRETLNSYCNRRRGPLKWGGFTVIGWSNLHPKAPGGPRGCFRRRIFWLKDYDAPNAGPYQHGGLPCEAVDPRTVRPGVPGEVTDRIADRGAAS